MRGSFEGRDRWAGPAPDLLSAASDLRVVPRRRTLRTSPRRLHPPLTEPRLGRLLPSGRCPALRPDRPRPSPTDPASSPRPHAALWPTATDLPLKAAPGYVGSGGLRLLPPSEAQRLAERLACASARPVQLATDGHAAAVRGRFDEAHFVTPPARPGCTATRPATS